MKDRHKDIQPQHRSNGIRNSKRALQFLIQTQDRRGISFI